MKKFVEKKLPWILTACILSIVLILFFSDKNETAGAPSEPTLTVQTPQKLSASDTREFTLDVMITALGEAYYPAMSMSISFDASKLEFLGVQEGNVFTLSSENSTGRQLPEWSCNVQNSNDSGCINIMYLDVTGGKCAFSKALLNEEENVLLRLSFRLRGSVRTGDVLDLIVEDAVFAASDETQSLAMTTGTLKTQNGRLVIGE